MTDYKIEITEISSVEKDVKVTVPEAVFHDKMEALYDDLSQNVSLKGFRKGKVPKKVIRNMYKKRVMKDVEEEILRESYGQAIEKDGLEPISMPDVREIDYDGEGDFVFSFTVETRPVVNDVNLDGIEVEKTKVVIEDEMIDKAIDYKRNQLATMKSVEGKEETELGDWIRMDYQAFVDDKPVFDKMEEQELELSNERQHLPGFVDALIGKKVNEEFEFNLTFPEDLEVDHLRGKEALFRCTIKAILERVIPEIDDELAKDLGDDYETMEQAREGIREELKTAEEGRTKHNLINEMWKKIIEANPIELPPKFVEEQTEQTMNRTMQQFMQQGISPDKLNLEPEAMKESAREETKSEIVRAFLEVKLANDYEIKVEDSDIDAYLEKISSDANVPIEQVKAYYSDEKQRDSLRQNLMSQKLADALMEKVNVKEVDPPKEEENKPVLGDDKSEE